MSNEHLVPVVIQDIVENLSRASNSNARHAYIQRLEATRDYINRHLEKHNGSSVRITGKNSQFFKTV